MGSIITEHPVFPLKEERKDKRARTLSSEQKKVSKEHKPGDYCAKCDSGEKEEKLILCDECDEGYHIYCLEPPLSRIPFGKWFCPVCETQKTEDATPSSPVEISVDFNMYPVEELESSSSSAETDTDTVKYPSQSKVIRKRQKVTTEVLPDGSKAVSMLPMMSYSEMISQALNSLGGFATNKEVTSYIEAHFPDQINYTTAKNWKNSVAGVLSQKFQRSGEAEGGRGKGCLWTFSTEVKKRASRKRPTSTNPQTIPQKLEGNSIFLEETLPKKETQIRTRNSKKPTEQEKRIAQAFEKYGLTGDISQIKIQMESLGEKESEKKEILRRFLEEVNEIEKGLISSKQKENTQNEVLETLRKKRDSETANLSTQDQNKKFQAVGSPIASESSEDDCEPIFTVVLPKDFSFPKVQSVNITPSNFLSQSCFKERNNNKNHNKQRTFVETPSILRL